MTAQERALRIEIFADMGYHEAACCECCEHHYSLPKDYRVHCELLKERNVPAMVEGDHVCREYK
jgi:hypothetical protein